MNRKYFFNPAKYGTHNIILRIALQFLLSQNIRNPRVLDVGCATGYIGREIRKQRGKLDIFGIEIDPEAASRASKFYSRVIIGDLNAMIKDDPVGLKKLLGGKKFDLIIFADVLEHLLAPQETLSFFVEHFLHKDGVAIISLPNVAHLTVRLSLLFGKFRYEETGILDKTHLHLYTLDTAKELICSCGLKPQKVAYSSNRFGFLIKKIPRLGTILGYNLIFFCKRNV